MNIEKIKKANTKELGKDIIYQEEMESTQDLAKVLVTQNFKNGTVIITDNQKRGRGTQGRNWITSVGKNITMTILLKKEWQVNELEGLTIKIAEAIQRGIKELLSVSLIIKKPNDLFLNGKKICGILTECSSTHHKVNYILIGIGFNVNEETFEGNLSDIATSLKKECRREFKREEIVIKILEELEKTLEL